METTSTVADQDKQLLEDLKTLDNLNEAVGNQHPDAEQVKRDKQLLEDMKTLDKLNGAAASKHRDDVRVTKKVRTEESSPPLATKATPVIATTSACKPLVTQPTGYQHRNFRPPLHQQARASTVRGKPMVSAAASAVTKRTITLADRNLLLEIKTFREIDIPTWKNVDTFLNSVPGGYYEGYNSFICLHNLLKGYFTKNRELINAIQHEVKRSQKILDEWPDSPFIAIAKRFATYSSFERMGYTSIEERFKKLLERLTSHMVVVQTQLEAELGGG